ncbi:MAG: hypothetical protein GY805_03290 [Chloroflexi bacterium]|nr:hypothetical protein [Chloroflexota bacterium]
MNTHEIIQKYIALFFSEKPNLDAIRSMLCDNFRFNGPLLKANTASEYIEQLEKIGTGNLEANVISILVNGDEGAVLYELITPFGKQITAEWFLFEEDRICSIRLLNDPRPFLAFFNGEALE